MIIILEFSEKQQAFHHNYGNEQEGSNGYRSLFSGTAEQLDSLSEKIDAAKEIRDNGYLTFERANDIVNGK